MMLISDWGYTVLSLTLNLTQFGNGNSEKEIVSYFNSLWERRSSQVNFLYNYCKENQVATSNMSSEYVLVNGETFRVQATDQYKKIRREISIIDTEIKACKQLIIAGRLDYDGLVNNDFLNQTIPQVNTLLKVKDSKTAIEVGSNSTPYIIDNVITDINTIYQTVDGKCIKQFRDVSAYDNELFFLDKLREFTFIPTLIAHDRNKKLIVMPWYEKINLQDDIDFENQISSALDQLKRLGIQHNDISIFSELYKENNQLKIIDWEFATDRNSKPTRKARNYDDASALNAYKIFKGLDRNKWYPKIRVSSILAHTHKAKNAVSYAIASYKIAINEWQKFVPMRELIETEYGYKTKTNDVLLVEFLMSKDELTHTSDEIVISDLSSIKKFIDVQSVYEFEDYFSHLWKLWWQLYFQTNEANQIFQFKRAGIEKRYELILKALGDIEFNDTILDIGSNAGEVSKYLAKHGYQMLGFETDTEVWKLSKENAPANCEFINSEFDRSVVLGKSKAALMLSVFHRIWALKGPSAARKTLIEIASCVDLLLFEGCTHLSRYGNQHMPDFQSNDTSKANSWHLQLFNELLPDWSIQLLAKIPHTSTEPYRLLYKLTKI